MIREIFSTTLRTFKTLKFRAGLNIILADKSEGASQRQTRNGAGKSSLLEIVHFLTSGDCKVDKSDRNKSCIFRLPELENHAFAMKMDLAGQPVIVNRTGAEHGTIVVDPGETSKWPIQPALDKKSGEMRLKRSEWADVLGSIMFGVEPDRPKHGPGFRGVFPYFCRRQIDGGFSTPQSFYSQQSVGRQQVAISFLLGLDWHVPGDLQESRDKEKSIATLKREAGSGVLESFIGKTGDLRSQLTISERKAKKLDDEIATFQVLPKYHELEQEASELARHLSDSSNANTVDQERVDVLAASLADEQEPPTRDVVRVYEEAGVVLSEIVTKRLEKVMEFHQAVLRNRKSHLESEIRDARSRLESRRLEMSETDGRRIEILTTLDAHGALDQLHRLQREYAKLVAKTEEVRRKYKLAKQLEATKSEISLERAQIFQRLIRDHEEHNKVIDEAVVLFEEFSEALSVRQGHLTVTASETGPQFEIEVPSGRSVGIRNMQVFCFDLMLITLWTRRGLGPGFLIHDSHLFDGVDSRQVANAIEIAAKRAKEDGFQYIITLNSDMLPRDEFSDEFNPDEFVLSVRLDDATETGGLFGFRF